METTVPVNIDFMISEIVCMLYCNATAELIDYDFMFENDGIDPIFKTIIIMPEYKYLPNNPSTFIMRKMIGEYVIMIDYGSSRKTLGETHSYLSYSTGHQAPENLSLERAYNQGTDVWALGFTLIDSNVDFDKSDMYKIIQKSTIKGTIHEIEHEINELYDMYENMFNMCKNPYAVRAARLCMKRDPVKDQQPNKF